MDDECDAYRDALARTLAGAEPVRSAQDPTLDDLFVGIAVPGQYVRYGHEADEDAIRYALVMHICALLAFKRYLPEVSARASSLERKIILRCVVLVATLCPKYGALLTSSALELICHRDACARYAHAKACAINIITSGDAEDVALVKRLRALIV